MNASDRYHRQILLPQIGAEGQQRLRAARVLLVGCGALGTVIAEQLVRAGIGLLRICDRDVVELTNLQRQTLFCEGDVDWPKAIVAAQRLAKINSKVEIDPKVVDLHSENVEPLCSDVNLIVDATDNVETRYLLNDAAVKLGLPWVYGACVGTSGQLMPIIPGRSACLRCVFPTPPGPGELPTCDTAGVLASAASIVASLQVVTAIRLLADDATFVPELTRIDVWPLRVTSTSIAEARRDDCMTCGQRRFEFFDRRVGGGATTLCGRNTVQIRPAGITSKLDLGAISGRLEPVGDVSPLAELVRCTFHEGGLSLTLFPDGRALVHGTSDTALARSIYAKYVGS
jgi:adenylyltransferase/sulfurtransferase